MFISFMNINTPLIMNMNMICEQLRLFLRTWEKSCYKQSCEFGDRKSTRLNSSHKLTLISYAVFCLGHFPPGGGNHHHRHHQRSSHRERAISINIFTSAISSPNPSSSLVSNSCLQVRDWCQQVASSVDYSLQLMLVGLFGGRSYVQILYAHYYPSNYEHEYAF